MGDVVLYAVERGVARVTLNRPDRLNASNGELSRALTAAMNRAAANPEVRVVLLSGAGRGFCAGADLQVLDGIAADPSGEHGGSNGLRYDGLMALPKPVIAAIHGPCAGMGLALACSADIRIAATSAFFLAPFATLGLCAEGGLAWLLSRTIGSGNAAEMLLSARRMPAAEALAKGLVSRVFEDGRFAETALDYAVAIATGAPSSFAMIKRQLARSVQSFEESREEATMLAHETFAADDFREATAARRENRAAQFSGLSARFDPPVSDSGLR